MLSFLKKHFIPHHANDHRPHILRDLSTKNIIAFIIFIEIFTFLLPTFANVNLLGNMAAVLPSVLGELTNSARAKESLPVLAENPALALAAQMKADDMARKGYFAHTSPEGITPWYWIELAGYKYQYAGENLAVNFRDSKDVTNAWLNSPSHKANIVKGKYTEMGTGIAKGEYKGKNTIFVAQVYANPLPPPKAIPVAPAKPAKPKVEPSRVAVALPAPSQVLGVEAQETSSPVPPPATENLEKIPVKDSTNLERLVASPRNTTNVILAILFAVIAMTLLLYVVIKAHSHHMDLLTNGMAMLAIIGAVFIANYQFSYKSLIITESLDYSLLQK